MHFLDKEAIRNCRSTVEGVSNFVWFKGGNMITIVDASDQKNFKFTDIMLTEGESNFKY